MPTASHTTNLSADKVGAMLVTLLASGMVLAPGVSLLLGAPPVAQAVAVRGLVALMALVLVWVPFPVPTAWRRMLAVSLLAAHHVGVGVAVGLPMALLAELLVGAVFIGSLACWLLPRRGFGALLGITLALGTVALGLLPPGADPTILAVWASVFLLGGASAELSVWVGPRVRPPGAPPPPPREPAAPPADPPPQRGGAMSLAEQVGLGVATVRSSKKGLSGASRALLEMTAAWETPTAWWRQVVDRQRVPRVGGEPSVIEMFTPGMDQRRAFRMWAVAEPTGKRIYVQDISALTDVRREAERLSRGLEAARNEAAAARDARMEAFRARSHNLRTPLSNLMASLELATMSVDDGASMPIVREDLDSASRSADELLRELNHFLEDIIAESQGAGATDVVDLVGLVDSELDALQGARSVRRSYSDAALPVRGTRGELTALVQAVVRRAVVAIRGTVHVRVEATNTGDTRVVFQVSGRDGELVWAALRELSPRAASLGGRLEAGAGTAPALVLPTQGARGGVEAEVTWPGSIPHIEAPDTPSVGLARDEDTDDAPTHVGYARQEALGRVIGQAPPFPGA